MIITDTTQNPAVNTTINLKDLGSFANGRVDCAQVLLTGTVTAGTVKLIFSQDNINFYPLTDDYGAQLALTPHVPLYLKFANIYIKCDLEGVEGQDIKVQVQ